MADSEFRTIPIKGRLLLVDDPDYALATSKAWQLQAGKAGTIYAAGNDYSSGKPRKVYLHRLIAGAANGQRVDHINGNGLDNRRSNLRICSNAENMRNMTTAKRGTSRFKGVSWFPRLRRWRAYIVVDAKQIHLGYYLSEEYAAGVYDEAARHRFGQFARLNFPVVPA